MSDENNDMRCVANEIILTLHKEKQLGQLEILLRACRLAVKDLSPSDIQPDSPAAKGAMRRAISALEYRIGKVAGDVPPIDYGVTISGLMREGMRNDKSALEVLRKLTDQ